MKESTIWIVAAMILLALFCLLLFIPKSKNNPELSGSSGKCKCRIPGEMGSACSTCPTVTSESSCNARYTGPRSGGCVWG